MIQDSEGTKPNSPITPKRRGGPALLLNALILLAVLALAMLGGYQAGISARKQNQSDTISQQLAEQFQFVDQDIQAGHYQIARQRLEFILEHDPAYPGAQEKLTQVLVEISLREGIQSPTPTPAPTTTPDFSGAEQAFASAAQRIAAQDWPGAIQALDQLRKLDPSFQQSQVDGMYYFALRNQGYNLITQQGNLEGGIYYLTLAERFGPLDRDTNGLREGARVYLIGASFWELNWQQALFYFEQASAWGNLWDGTMTASARYQFAAMRYADELFAGGQYCDAVTYYQKAQTGGGLDKTAQNNFDEAFLVCFPPTATPAPATETPTSTPPVSYP